jgi:hypothetical protein
MTELNNNVIVRFSYEKLTTLDEVNGSLKMIQEVFYYNSKNKTLSHSCTQWPYGKDVKPDRDYKTVKQLSGSDAKNLIDTINSAINQVEKSDK